MSAEIFQFRPFEAARNEARKFCPNLLRNALTLVREEQRQGSSGAWVAGEIMKLRLAAKNTPPQDAA